MYNIINKMVENVPIHAMIIVQFVFICDIAKTKANPAHSVGLVPRLGVTFSLHSLSFFSQSYAPAKYVEVSPNPQGS